MEGGPTPEFFHPHGIDVSNSTDRLFAVNHGDVQSSVEVYKIIYDEECISDSSWTCSPVILKFITSVKSELFPKYGINDVAEIDSDNFYVTQWRVYPAPEGGTGSPTSIMEIFQTLMALPIFVFNIKWTTVHVCSVSEGICRVATNEKFLGANGITVNKERSLVFVNDPTEKLVTVLRRGDNFQLVKESVIKLPVTADNIEYDEEANEIVIGTIPDLTAMVKFMDGDRSIAVPGGMAIASSTTSGWKVRDVLEHDGTKLCGISSALRFGSKVVLGSPGSEGILVCYDVSY